MDEGSPSSIISPNDVTSNSISLNTTSPSIDASGRSDLEVLRNHVRALEAENLALRRTIPRLKTFEGRDVTNEMASLTAQLAATEERLEDASNDCARKHKELETLRSQYLEMEMRKDEEIAQAIERAIHFENETKRLMQELENDESKLFHLNQQVNSGEFAVARRPAESRSLHSVQNEISKRNEQLSSMVFGDGGHSNLAIMQHLSELNADSSQSSQANSVIEGGDALRRRNRLAATSFSELVNTDVSVAEMVNRTVLDVTQDMSAIACRMNALQSVCEQLFRKLGDTALFLESLLSSLDDAESEDARQIIDRIRQITLDLDKSMREAKQATEMLTKSQRSLVDLRTFVEHTVEGTNHLKHNVTEGKRVASPAESDASLRSVSSAPALLSGISIAQRNESDRSSLTHRVNELNKELTKLKEMNASLMNSLKNELKRKDALSEEISQLKGHLEQYESELTDARSRIQQYNEVIEQQRHDLQIQLQELNRYTVEREQMKNIIRDSSKKLKIMEEKEADAARIVENYRQLEKSNRDLFADKANIEQYLNHKSKELEAEREKVQQLRISNLDYDKSNRELHKRYEKLKQRHEHVVENFRTTNERVHRANMVLHRKINEGLQRQAKSNNECG